MEPAGGALRQRRWFLTILLGASLLARAGMAYAQVSPGPLAQPHQEMDSNLKCFNCHGQRGQGGGMPDRCLACHKEIAAHIDGRTGLHARVPKQDCAKCHPDHAGRDFEMIQWEEGGPAKFDHGRSGWPLAGKHARLECKDCHKAAFQSPAIMALAPGKGRAQGYIGLNQACDACHHQKDIHHGALGKDCAKCHGQEAWKPATNFDHARTDYPLTGRHAKVTCEKCHLAPALKLATDKDGHRVPLYKPLPHKECAACHADPHTGRFGAACSKCHVTDDWKVVGKERFNHDLTRYPLRGRHVAVRCEQCHDPKSPTGKKPPFATCGTCHADAHAGKALLAGRPVDCAACHDVAGWKPATYTVEQHKSASYPLEGAHRSVPCSSCHRKSPSGVDVARLGSAGVAIRMGHEHCLDCHEDSHGGQLAKAEGRGACEPCHRVEAWKPSTYTVAQHARLRLPLLGRHAQIACAACHGPARPGLPALPGSEVLGKARVGIHLKEIACEACHADPHEGRFGAQRASAKQVTRRPAGCTACHGVSTFRPSTVDVAMHAAFGFPLEAAHGAAPCESCHKEMKTPRAVSSLLLSRGGGASMAFAVKDQRCEACHQNPHGTQFEARRDHGQCAACHNALAFRPAGRFEHDRDAGFRLLGVHAKVACGRCHVPKKDAAGRVMVIYRPVPKDCKSCHGAGIPAPRGSRS